MPHGLPPQNIPLQPPAAGAGAGAYGRTNRMPRVSSRLLHPSEGNPMFETFIGRVKAKVAAVPRGIRTLVGVLILGMFVSFGLGFCAGPAKAQALTDYLENALINHLFRGTALTAPTTIYVGLSTTACSDSSPGTEVAAGAYARVAVAATTANWAAPTGGNGATSNLTVVTFPVPSAGWGTVTHWQLFDAATGGNQLICAALTTSKTINQGDTVSFPPAALTVTLG
jgi:hypothetical protein